MDKKDHEIAVLRLKCETYKSQRDFYKREWINDLLKTGLLCVTLIVLILIIDA